MEIIYGNKISSQDRPVVDRIARNCGINVLTAELLFCRGFDTEEKVLKFINPGKNGFHDPYLLNGVKEAVNLLYLAKETEKSVLIFGDYDADGICAVSVLNNCLKDFGIKCDFIVPEREDGYGLNYEIISRLNEKKKIDILISVDCGISDYDTIEKLKAIGIKVIVTDHHEPPTVIPDTIVINPKIEGQDYPFNKLAGAGVAYKLGSALIGEGADKYLDAVALATVADSMELVGENRDIVSEGLKLFNSNQSCLPLRHMSAELNRRVTAGTLAYALSPRINAGGRMGDAMCALKLMTSDDLDEIKVLAEKLDKYNSERQVYCDMVYAEAKERIKKLGLIKNKVILVADDTWQAGVVGIVASRLVEEYMRPVIVFAKHGDNYKGSCRSIDGINILDAITSAEDLLVAFGGHSQAAGVTVEKENLDKLSDRLNAFVVENYKDLKITKKLYVDILMEDKFSIDFAREIERLEPFGVANKRPLFAVKEDLVKGSYLRGTGPYSFNTSTVEMLDFSGQKHVDVLSLPFQKTLIFDSNLSSFRGRESLKGFLRHVVINADDVKNEKTFVFQNQLKTLRDETVLESNVLDYSEMKKASGCGTLYVLSDMENFNAYSELKDLPFEMFEVQENNVLDRVIVAPSKIPDGFDQVVYLDEPISFLPTDANVYCNFELCGYELLEYVETEREALLEVYSIISSYDGTSYTSSADFYNTYAPIDNPFQMIFAMEVFLELGLFSVENGKLKRNAGVKNPLTNSKIYNKVLEIRG